MKTLYITRHAKSDWKAEYGTDFDRGLNKRGQKDAPFMGNILREKGVKPERILSSPAVRAKTTAVFLADALHYKQEDIVFEESIYEADTDTIINLIHKTEDEITSLMLVGHNPAFTSVINRLSNVTLDNLPTSGVMAIKFEVSAWHLIEPYMGEMLFFEYPKKYQ